MRIATIIALGFSLLLTDRNGSEAGDPPAGGAVFQTDAQKAAFKTHLSDILVEGLARQQASVKTTDDRVASARRLTTDRAPLEHAYGLVLLRRLKYRDALAQFVSASDSTELPFLPAWRARIVLRLKLKDRSGFSTDLRKLATLTMDESHPWADSAQRLDAAGLIGRFAAFAALPEVKLIPSAEADALDTALREILADEYRAAYSSGRVAIQFQQRALAKQIDAESAEAQARAAKRIEQKLTKLEARKEPLKDEAETLELTSKEWDAWMDKQSKQSEERLKILSKDHDVITVAVRVLDVQILGEQQACVRVRSELAVLNGRIQRNETAQPRRARLYETEIAQRESTIRQLFNERVTLKSRGQAVINAARNTIAQRRAALARYQAATGRRLKQTAALERWERELARSAQKLESEKGQDSARVLSLKKRLSAPDAFFPIDFTSEAEHIYARYGLVSAL